MSVETSSVLSVLGLNSEELEWQDLALCNGNETEMFYDHYESNDGVARMVDEMCLSCPVLTQCLSRGLENKEWGIWGGVFLVNGKVDKNRNSHKSPETWQALRERIGGESIF